MKIKEDLTNKKYGKLKVLHRDVSKIGLQRGSFWTCQCDCGIVKSISRHSLVNRGTKSCGCLQKVAARGLALPNAEADKNYWIGKYKARASKLNIEFSLSDEQFHDICSMNCFYCDEKPTERSCGYKSKNYNEVFLANGIDRIVPTEGYTKKNSVPCCTPCNLMKTDKSQEEFIDLVTRIANKHGRNNVL